jgi:hypothetical protein
MFDTPHQSIASIRASIELSKREHATANRRLAAKARRNLAIFKRAEIENFTHEEVACRFDLKRSRVSQIVKQVRCELAQASTDDPEINDLEARRRLEKSLEKLRLEYALEASAKAMRRDPRILNTSRTGSREKNGQQETWSENVSRDKAPDVQAIKTYLRVAGDLGKLNERDAPAEPVKAKMTDEELFFAVHEVIQHWCFRSHDSENCPSQEFYEMVDEFRRNVFTWVNQRREGVSRQLAWPLQKPARPAVEHDSDVSDSDGSDADGSAPGEINHPAAEINLGLTKNSANSPAASSGSQSI